MEKVAIVSIIYNEAHWYKTERCIDRCNCPKFFVDRHGIGSLAKAINSGFHQWGQGFEYIWFITNVTFSSHCLTRLVEQMEMYPWAGITPSFQSDHLFCRPKHGIHKTLSVPFIEFTAPIVRSSVFGQFLLDEKMPYWGHDLDWGYRVREAGYKVGCFHGEQLGHEYIRMEQKEKITQVRWHMRKKTNHSTRQALVRKYGVDWKKVLQWQG